MRTREILCAVADALKGGRAVRYRTSVEQKAGTMILVDGRLDSGEPRWTTSLRDLTIEKESVADCKILPSPGEMTVGG